MVDTKLWFQWLYKLHNHNIVCQTWSRFMGSIDCHFYGLLKFYPPQLCNDNIWCTFCHYMQRAVWTFDMFYIFRKWFLPGRFRRQQIKYFTEQFRFLSAICCCYLILVVQVFLDFQAFEKNKVRLLIFLIFPSISTRKSAETRFS